MKPVVAIIGRPNAGKSTLFNRITRTKDALVDDFPGVTRDRHYGSSTWDDVEFSVIDTGGFSIGDDDDFSSLSRDQVHQAISDADAIILLLDGKHGVSPFDSELIKILRELSCPIFYAVNKIDSYEKEENINEFYSLGIDTLYPVSAEHGYGIPDFLDSLVSALPTSSAEDDDDDGAIKIAIIGRPNVGKSSLTNRILGENRVIVSDIPGTTRDSIDTACEINGRQYLLIDTAGIRRKKQVYEKIEKISIIKALKSIERCDIALIIIDAHDGITDQDVKIAGYAFERGCGCIFLLNKWDLVEKDNKTLNRYIEKLRMEAKFLSFTPVLALSALTGKRVPKIFDLVNNVYEQYTTRIATGPLNKIFERATLKTEPSLHKGRRIKFFYATQISAKPPTFISFVNSPDGIHFSYQRYLINQIRQATGLDQTPVRLFFRKRHEAGNRISRKKSFSAKSRKKKKRS
ncbi:MAG: ribosome biogenesis GTPase Der [Desulfobacteraceae bacterium]|nr:ribosome biogenesis GTPase Der [Desulfobacteraceae bacterium]MBC2754074.1 ribosome biogenesis GTPase Der [Desulfobacteraceae bacterium]